MIHILSKEKLSFETIEQLLSKGQLSLSQEAIEAITKCRDYLDKKLTKQNSPIYGINTGFGSLYKERIPAHELEQLQINLVRSHACGTGPEIPQQVVKLMLLLKIQSLVYGHSGVQESTVQRLIDFFNHHVLPVVYEQGSLGASGDLAPLAHLSLALIGEGEVYYKEKKLPAQHVLQELKLEPIKFKAKEGLALINGTQFMSAFGTLCILEARRLSSLSDILGALSIDAFDGRIEPFDKKLHSIRPHKGQVDTARKVRELLKDSEIISQEKKHVQDPYSFRCIPQVHGASKDTFRHCEEAFLTEINGVTDNPNIFPEDDEIISGGNFHGQCLALPMDFMAIALHELGNISERRTYQLISGARDLPNFLVANPGLNSGLMIPQYTAASIVSQNKQLCTPASIDSIVSSNGQEDHVSMGANAATKLYRVVNNVYSIFAIELLTAAQAIDLRRPLKTSTALETFISKYRKVVPFIENDRILHNDIVKSDHFLREVNF